MHLEGGSALIAITTASDTLNTNPRYDQYLTHAHSHITWAVAPMDSCFDLVRPHQHGIVVGQQIGLKALCSLPFTTEADAKHPFKRQLHTTHGDEA